MTIRKNGDFPYSRGGKLNVSLYAWVYLLNSTICRVIFECPKQVITPLNLLGAESVGGE